MIFQWLGRFIRGAWIPILVAWAALLVAMHFAAPPFDEVARDKGFALLPADAPSRQAEEAYARAFPDRYASNIVLVLHRADASRSSRAADRKFISDVLEPALFEIAQSEGGLAGTSEPSDEPLFGD